MDQVLHGSARTTPAVRQAIKASTENLAKLAARHGLNEKTVAKWRGRISTQDAPMGPKNPVSTVLSRLEEAAAVTFRQHTHLPLDDCLYALQESIPTWRARRCIVYFNATVSASYLRRLRPTRPLKSSARPIPSAISTSILRNCAWPMANSTSQMLNAHFCRH